MSERESKEGSEAPRVPTAATEAGLAFVRSAKKDFGLFGFLTDLAVHSDYFAFVAEKALAGEQYDHLEPGDLAQQAPGRKTQYLRDNRQVFLEMFLTRLIDNFQCYVVDLVREVLQKKPEMLKSKQQALSFEELLSFSRIEDVIQHVIERRVGNLSYEGFGALESWCAERGIWIGVPDGKRETIIELIATRNLIAHNRGVIDRRYRQSVSHARFEEGEMRSLEVDEFLDAIYLFHEVVSKTDEVAATKFDLSTYPVGEYRGRAT